MNTPEIKAAAETAKNIISHETYLKMKDDSIILPSEMDKRILSKAREIDRNRYKRKKYIKAAVFFVAFLIIINIAAAYSKLYIPEIAGNKADISNVKTSLNWEASYLPDEFIYYGCKKSMEQEEIIYKANNGDKSIGIYYSENSFKEDGSTFENTKIVEVNGSKGVIRYNEYKNRIVLSWHNNGYFKIEGINIYDLSEIINVANGIKMHENLFLQKTKFIKLTDLYGQTH